MSQIQELLVVIREFISPKENTPHGIMLAKRDKNGSQIGQFIKETLANQVRQLYGLQKGENSFQEHLLESIFNTLVYANKINKADQTILSQLEHRKLAECCTKVVGSHQSVKPGYVRVHKPELWAVRILVLIAEQPFREPHSRETLHMIHESLVKKLQQILYCSYDNPTGFRPDDLTLTGLIAYCLTQNNLEHIVSPVSAYNLIKDLMFPLAVWCFSEETKYKRITFKDFEDNFHGLDKDFRNQILTAKSFHAYPLMIRLLSTLMDRSESVPVGGSRKRFVSMLDMATKNGGTRITDEHIVALNVIVAHNIGMFVEGVLIDLLDKSEHFHRVHIAYITLKAIMIFDTEDECVSYSWAKKALATAMIGDLISRDDKLLDKIALSSLSYLHGQPNYLGNYFMTTMGRGKLETRTMKKLLEISIKPIVHYQLLDHFDRIAEPLSALEFDGLARILITYDIDKLYQLINLWKRDDEQKSQFNNHLKRLVNLLRLRRHRLEASVEIKLLELFDLLTNYEFNEYLTSDYGMLLVFANCFQIHPSARHSLVKLIQFDERTRFLADIDEHGLRNRLTGVTETINTALSHFLMADTDHFWAELASIELMELIYRHCKRAVDSGSPKTLLKEILLAWPKEFEKTKMDSSEYHTMLNKFIRLLIGEFERDKDKVSTTREDNKCIIGALSGLVVAFCRHREILHEVLDSLSDERFEMRESWTLRDVIYTRARLLIESLANEVDCSNKMINGLSNCQVEEFKEAPGGRVWFNGFADVVIANEGLIVINEDHSSSRGHSDKLKQLSAGALLAVIRSAVKRCVELAPVDSLESKRYQEINWSRQLSMDDRQQTRLVNN